MSNVRRPTGLVPTPFEVLVAVTIYVLSLLIGAWFVPEDEMAQYMWSVFAGLFIGLCTRDVAHWIRTEL